MIVRTGRHIDYQQICGRYAAPNLPIHACLSIGGRYAAPNLPIHACLSIGGRYAAPNLPIHACLSIGGRYAAPNLPIARVYRQVAAMRPEPADSHGSIDRWPLRGLALYSSNALMIAS